MIVRGICSALENQLRLLSSDKHFIFKAFVHFRGDKATHFAFAFAAIKIAAIVAQDVTGPTRTCVNRGASGFFINTVADANDHENDLHHLRMIVNNF